MKMTSSAAWSLVVLAGALPAVGRAQAVPQGAEASATPSVPSLNRAPETDQLRVTLGASESLLWGYNGASGTTSSTNVNGSAAYVSGSQSHPTSFLYSGGYLIGNGSYQSGSYQNFGISQQFLTRHYSFVVGDTVSYLPNAPVFGLSGVPGVGDIGTQPIGTGAVPTDSILSYYGRRVSNTTSGSVTTKFTPSTTATAYGSFTLQRFIDGTGIDNNELDAGLSINHRIDPKNSFGVGGQYSRFTYLPTPLITYYRPANFLITTESANVQYEHVFTRRLTFNASAGPQWTQSSQEVLVPKRLDFATTDSLFYLDKNTQYLLAYSRGTSAGSGVLIGTTADNVNFTADHSFGRNWNGGFSADYGHARSLVVLGGQTSYTSTFYTGVQATRKLGRFWSAYGSYNLEYQTTAGPINELFAFNGHANILGFGVNYSPRPYHMHKH